MDNQKHSITQACGFSFDVQGVDVVAATVPSTRSRR